MSGLVLIPAPAFAAGQSGAAAATTTGVGQFVVTAQKRSENIQNVPIAISAVSGNYLASRAITARPSPDKTITRILIRGSG